MRKSFGMKPRGLAIAIAVGVLGACSFDFDAPFARESATAGSSSGGSATGGAAGTAGMAPDAGAGDGGDAAQDSESIDSGQDALSDTGAHDASPDGSVNDSGDGGMTTCVECTNDYCSAEAAACQAETDCSDVLACLSQCADMTCAQDCVQQNPTAIMPLLECMTTNCQTVCNLN